MVAVVSLCCCVERQGRGGAEDDDDDGLLGLSSARTKGRRARASSSTQPCQIEREPVCVCMYGAGGLFAFVRQ